MGNSQPASNLDGQTTYDRSTGEQIVNFNLFSDDECKEKTHEEIEASQVDYFSSDQRLDELKTILGEDIVNNQLEYYKNVTKVTEECLPVMAITKDYPFMDEYIGHYLVACLMRKSESFAKHSKPFKCLDDGYLDEILDVNTLKKYPTKILKQKFEEFHQDFQYCMSVPNSNEYSRVMETVSLETVFKEPYSAILSQPNQIEIIKSRFLPKQTTLEVKKIEHEPMEPYIYNPKTDTEEDFERKLIALSQTDFLKQDIELVKECYQKEQESTSADCFGKYNSLLSISELVLCKKEILTQSPQLTFPNIEDSALLDFKKDGSCSGVLLKNHIEKLFPNMPKFHYLYFYNKDNN
ncbi:predicted protein [Naegleria gruberi]|uniref:Predicted protein n=1 Tax=Naegleria gruberi TaxID=5762 RepID=D2VW25_NAEGR|nr:uncharacterized protein NAEGRDRAFT_52710 [Naegleria gruberi]EFC38941.1 predicted protein [Naegleria gruberi]|eukprot:XP_002671685.1 predicted protein [Naegleria gruberi strain NEG-M]